MFLYIDMFSGWLKAVGLTPWVDRYEWIVPGSQAVHFFGLALLFSVIALLDLRLVGFLKGLPIAQITRLIPLAMAGFAMNVVTGFLNTRHETDCAGISAASPAGVEKSTCPAPVAGKPRHSISSLRSMPIGMRSRKLMVMRPGAAGIPRPTAS